MRCLTVDVPHELPSVLIFYPFAWLRHCRTLGFQKSWDAVCADILSVTYLWLRHWRIPHPHEFPSVLTCGYAIDVRHTLHKFPSVLTCGYAIDVCHTLMSCRLYLPVATPLTYVTPSWVAVCTYLWLRHWRTSHPHELPSVPTSGYAIDARHSLMSCRLYLPVATPLTYVTPSWVAVCTYLWLRHWRTSHPHELPSVPTCGYAIDVRHTLMSCRLYLPVATPLTYVTPSWIAVCTYLWLRHWRTSHPHELPSVLTFWAVPGSRLPLDSSPVVDRMLKLGYKNDIKKVELIELLKTMQLTLTQTLNPNPKP